MKKLCLAVVFSAAAALASAQTQAPSTYSTTQTVTTTTVATTSSGANAAPAPTVLRTIKAMHYRLQGGSARIDFHGSDLMQRATGEAKVEGKKTNFQIEAKFEDFEDATKFGLEYLTYVLWAVSPDNKFVKLGQIVNTPGRNEAEIRSETALKDFGLLVTMENAGEVTSPIGPNLGVVEIIK